MLDVAGLAPPILHSMLARSLYATRLFNITITNVPGPRIPLFALGAPLRAIYPLVPLAAEHSIGIAIFSYMDEIAIGVSADRDSCPDLEVMLAGIEAELAGPRRGRRIAVTRSVSTRLQEVEVQALDVARLEPLIGPERMAAFERVADEAQAALDGRAVLNVNSTAKGGGVAEMLQTLLAYVRGAGIDARWLVIEGDERFFAITKRIHNGIYGSPGDGGPLGEAERRHYEDVLRRNADELRALVRPGDLVLLHDPQPLGLAGGAEAGGSRGGLALPHRARRARTSGRDGRGSSSAPTSKRSTRRSSRSPVSVRPSRRRRRCT